MYPDEGNRALAANRPPGVPQHRVPPVAARLVIVTLAGVEWALVQALPTQQVAVGGPEE